MTCVECRAILQEHGAWPKRYGAGPPQSPATPCPRCGKERCEPHHSIHEIRCYAKTPHAYAPPPYASPRRGTPPTAPHSTPRSRHHTPLPGASTPLPGAGLPGVRAASRPRARGGEARYVAKRAAGISPVRYDGSVSSAETDRQAAAAEEFAAGALGAQFNSMVYATRGDGGHDFTVTGPGGTVYTVEAVWLGYVAGTEEPRGREAHLIINPEEPQRWADLYVAVSGSTAQGFALEGWTKHADLVAAPRRNFGFGLKLALPVKHLRVFRS